MACARSESRALASLLERGPYFCFHGKAREQIPRSLEAGPSPQGDGEIGCWGQAIVEVHSLHRTEAFPSLVNWKLGQIWKTNTMQPSDRPPPCFPLGGGVRASGRTTLSGTHLGCVQSDRREIGKLFKASGKFYLNSGHFIAKRVFTRSVFIHSAN